MKNSGSPRWALICQPSLIWSRRATVKRVPGWTGFNEGNPWTATTWALLAGAWAQAAGGPERQRAAARKEKNRICFMTAITPEPLGRLPSGNKKAPQKNSTGLLVEKTAKKWNHRGHREHRVNLLMIERNPLGLLCVLCALCGKSVFRFLPDFPRGFPFDQLGLEGGGLFKQGFFKDDLEELSGGQFPHLISREGNRSQGGFVVGSFFHIIETKNRDVLGDVHPFFLQGPDGAQGHQVAGAEDGAGPTDRGQNLEGRLVTALLLEIPVRRPFLVEFQLVFGQVFLEGLETLQGVGGGHAPVDDADPLVAQLDQVFNGDFYAPPVVETHVRKVLVAGDLPVDQDEGNIGLGQFADGCVGGPGV